MRIHRNPILTRCGTCINCRDGVVGPYEACLLERYDRDDCLRRGRLDGLREELREELLEELRRELRAGGRRDRDRDRDRDLGNEALLRDELRALRRDDSPFFDTSRLFRFGNER